MQPPSDSLLHHSHKLGEVAASLRNRATFSPPPPPYSSTDAQDPVQEGRQAGVEIDDDDESTWDANPPVVASPITINIDASIKVVGNGNTVMIPSMAGDAQQGSAPATTPGTPEAASSPSSPAGTPTAVLRLQLTQKHRQAKLTEMATSIINALYESGRLAGPGENCESGPVEININTGIKVEGSRNVICVGAPNRLQNKGAGAGAGAQTGSEKGQHATLNRKKRALSEPLEVPASKKNCLP